MGNGISVDKFLKKYKVDSGTINDTRKGNTVLHIAIEKNNPKIVNRLLKLGADPRLVNKNGKIPLEQTITIHQNLQQKWSYFHEELNDEYYGTCSQIITALIEYAEKKLNTNQTYLAHAKNALKTYSYVSFEDWESSDYMYDKGITHDLFCHIKKMQGSSNTERNGLPNSLKF